jgi:hypothetical protein
MPIIPDDRIQYNTDRAINYIAPDSDDVEFKDKLRSAFRLENTLISGVSQTKGLPDGYASTDYSPIEKLTEDEKLNKSFVNLVALADNDSEVEAVREQFKREEADKANLTGITASLAAGTFDLINLFPVGGAATRAFRSGNALKGALATGLTAAGSAGVAEIGLHATQLTRTGEESAYNLTGGLLLGGTLGASVARLGKTPLQLKETTDEIEKSFEGPLVNTVDNGGSVGAASAWGDVRVKGKKVEMAMKALSPIDPLAKVMTSKSKAARKYGALLAENPLEIEGFSGRSIEQTSRTKQQAYFGRALNEHIDTFTKAKKEGYTGKRGEFNNLVSKEIANPGSTGNKHAARSASTWSKNVYDPIAKELQELNLLGDDLDVKTAARYLNRRWNKEAVGGKLNEFRTVVSKWLQDTQPDIEDADELADEIAMRIMGTPDGMIRYDKEFYTSKRAKGADDLVDAEIDIEKLKGFDVDESVVIKETGERTKVKADASEVYNRLTKQKNMLEKLKGCLGA